MHNGDNTKLGIFSFLRQCIQPNFMTDTIRFVLHALSTMKTTQILDYLHSKFTQKQNHKKTKPCSLLIFPTFNALWRLHAS